MSTKQHPVEKQIQQLNLDTASGSFFASKSMSFMEFHHQQKLIDSLIPQWREALETTTIHSAPVTFYACVKCLRRRESNVQR